MSRPQDPVETNLRHSWLNVTPSWILAFILPFVNIIKRSRCKPNIYIYIYADEIGWRGLKATLLKLYNAWVSSSAAAQRSIAVMFKELLNIRFQILIEVTREFGLRPVLGSWRPWRYRFCRVNFSSTLLVLVCRGHSFSLHSYQISIFDCTSDISERLVRVQILLITSCLIIGPS